MPKSLVTGVAMTDMLSAGNEGKNGDSQEERDLCRMLGLCEIPDPVKRS